MIPATIGLILAVLFFALLLIIILLFASGQVHLPFYLR